MKNPYRSTQSIHRNRRSAFTLLELLLVMAILVVLASLSGFAILSLREGALQKNAFLEIETMRKACTMYKTNVGTFPTSLEDLYTLPNGLTKMNWGGPYLDGQLKLDPWQQPYIYTPDDVNQRVIITSNGPDRQSGTEDDLPQAVKQ